ncbi:MAG: deoxyribose-phosphate aldolase [Halobacteriota archaeon]
MSLVTELERSPASIAALIEQTNVDPVASRADIERLCADVNRFGFHSAVVVPYHARLARDQLGDTASVGTVIGFPYGVQSTAAKRAEIDDLGEAVDEFDMVMNRTAFRNGDDDLVVEDIRGVRAAAGDRILKCIIESPTLDPDAIARAARLVEEGGADFVKTAVGYDGPTDPTEVGLIREAVSDEMGVKASGGIASYEDALAMVEAGASRIGTSSGRAIMDSLPADDEGGV